MTGSYRSLVDKAHWEKGADELISLSPAILKGVTEADATSLARILGIETIRDLARNRHFRAAVAIDAGVDHAFDRGPPLDWAQLFASAPLATYEARPDLFRLDFGPVFYRGRLDGTARLLVVGQDPSVNEILAQRVFVGRSGQRLQGFLAKLGVTRSYLMLNTFSYSIFGQFGGDNEELSHEDPILVHRNECFDRVEEENPLQAVITVGRAAREAVERWPSATELPLVSLIHPAFPDTSQLLANWNDALAALRPVVPPDEGKELGIDYGTGFLPDEVIPIPRADLPFGLPAWHGSGDHGRRQGDEIVEWHSDEID